MLQPLMVSTRGCLPEEAQGLTANLVEIIRDSELSLLALPSEIHLEIFKHLDSASSTCLGLASTHFWSIHQATHGKVPLTAWCILPPNRMSGRHLFELLASWMAPQLEFFTDDMKFLAKEKVKEKQKMSSKTSSYVAEMKCIQQQAKAWKEQGGWYEDGVWQILYVPRRSY